MLRAAFNIWKIYVVNSEKSGTEALDLDFRWVSKYFYRNNTTLQTYSHDVET